MISARNALSLPSARLRPSDQEAAEAVLRDVETYVRANMDRGGCLVPVDPLQMNGAIAAEVIRVCRSEGWIAEFQTKTEKSALNGQPVIAAFHLSLQPSPESYDEISEPAGNSRIRQLALDIFE